MITQFGEKIKSLRVINHLRQKQVAEKLGIDTPLLCKIEKGERIAKRNIISQFAEIFKTREEELIVAWLADQLFQIVKDENNAIEAISFVGQLLQVRKIKTT